MNPPVNLILPEKRTKYISFSKIDASLLDVTFLTTYPKKFIFISSLISLENAFGPF